MELPVRLSLDLVHESVLLLGLDRRDGRVPHVVVRVRVLAVLAEASVAVFESSEALAVSDEMARKEKKNKEREKRERQTV